MDGLTSQSKDSYLSLDSPLLFPCSDAHPEKAALMRWLPSLTSSQTVSFPLAQFNKAVNAILLHGPPGLDGTLPATAAQL